MHDEFIFLTAMYLTPRRPGPAPALSPSEALTLYLLAQWQHFASERDFYRYAQRHWRAYIPTLPARSHWLRLYPVLVAC